MMMMMMMMMNLSKFWDLNVLSTAQCHRRTNRTLKSYYWYVLVLKRNLTMKLCQGVPLTLWQSGSGWSFQEFLRIQLNPAAVLFTFSSPCSVNILITCNSVIHFPPSYLLSVTVKWFDPPPLSGERALNKSSWWWWWGGGGGGWWWGWWWCWWWWWFVVRIVLQFV